MNSENILQQRWKWVPYLIFLSSEIISFCSECEYPVIAVHMNKINHHTKEKKIHKLLLSFTSVNFHTPLKYYAMMSTYETENK